MLGAVPFLSPLYPHSGYGKGLATSPHTPPSSTPKHRAHGSGRILLLHCRGLGGSVGFGLWGHSPSGSLRLRERDGEGLAIYLGEELLVVLRALHEVLHILHSLYGVHLGEHLAYRPHTLLGGSIL